MNEVVVTGIGVVSSLGVGRDQVAKSLRGGRSGVVTKPDWLEAGLRVGVSGEPPDLGAVFADAPIPRRLRNALAPAAHLSAIAAQEAIADADLSPADLQAPDLALIVGSGIGDTLAIARGAAAVSSGRPRRVDPFTVLRAMGSGPAAGLVSLLGLRGRSYGLTSACATSAHCLAHGLELVRHGLASVVLAGGAEVIDLLVAAAFDAMRGALSTNRNAHPEKASRPFAADRDGLVLATGAALLVLEGRDRADARGARIHARFLGAACGSDPYDPVQPAPDGEAEADVMRRALADALRTPPEVGYVNAHATGTPAGDPAEVAALRSVFGPGLPPVSSTKSSGGHALGGAGAIEAVHAILALEERFLPPSLNASPRDPEFADLPIVEAPTPARPGVAISNSFGFGGALATLVFGSAAEA